MYNVKHVQARRSLGLLAVGSHPEMNTHGLSVACQRFPPISGLSKSWQNPRCVEKGISGRRFIYSFQKYLLNT